jgi:hypothetical protein
MLSLIVLENFHNVYFVTSAWSIQVVALSIPKYSPSYLKSSEILTLFSQVPPGADAINLFIVLS